MTATPIIPICIDPVVWGEERRRKLEEIARLIKKAEARNEHQS